MSGAGTITLDGATLGADVTTVGGAINFSGAVTLDKSGGTSTVSSGTGAGDITFSGTIEDDSAGDTALSIDAGSADVTFSSTIGASTAIGALTVLGNDLDLGGGNIEATGDVILVANNPGADAESITFSGRAIDANGGNVFLSADDITFGTGLASTGASGTTTLTIVGDTAASTITVAGGAGSDANLEISEADLATIGSDFSDVRIGMANADGTVGGEAQADQSGTITMNAGDGTLNFSAANLSLRGIAATTTITSAINTSGASGKTLDLKERQSI